MDKTKIIIAVLAGALVVSGIFWFTRPTATMTITKDGKEVPVGSAAGPIIPFDYFQVGDVLQFKRHLPSLNQASTTVCTFQSPGATSTLVAASVGITTGSTTATIWEMGKSTLVAATTTLIGGRWTLAANDLATFIASTTPFSSGNNEAFVFGPNQYLNIKYGGPVGALNVFTGSCNATFEVI